MGCNVLQSKRSIECFASLRENTSAHRFFSIPVPLPYSKLVNCLDCWILCSSKALSAFSRLWHSRSSKIFNDNTQGCASAAMRFQIAMLRFVIHFLILVCFFLLKLDFRHNLFYFFSLNAQAFMKLIFICAIIFWFPSRLNIWGKCTIPLISQWSLTSRDFPNAMFR